MDRRVLVTAVVAFSFALGCGRSAQEPAKPTEPAPAPATTEVAPAPAQSTAIPSLSESVQLVCVDKTGKATPDMITISKSKKTTVVWVGEDPVVGLDISFKDQCPGGAKHAHPPQKPKCDDATCTMQFKKYKDADEGVEFCYSMLVTVEGQPPKPYDPRLIINP